MNAPAHVAKQPTSVVERIAEAARSDTPIPSSDWLAMREEAAELLRGMTEAAADCEQQSLNPTNSVAEARAARNSAEDFRHEGRRLQSAIDQVDEILPSLKAAEHKAAIMPAYLAFKLERTNFALRLAETWPRLAGEMVELLREIERFDRTPPCEIPEGEDPLRISVEAMARGIPGRFHTEEIPPRPILRLGQARIPNFNGPGFAWTETSR